MSITPISLDIIRGWLSSHIDSFAGHNGHIRDMIEIKRTHSEKVAAHCRAIAEELGWNAHENDIAEAVGLLHDTGRFSQAAEYGTFSDALSVDHGLRGAEVIEREGVLDALDPVDRRRILDATLFHNRREVSPETPEASLPFVRLVRDADKLDIYRIALDRIESGGLADHLRSALRITSAGPASQGAVNDVLGNMTVANDHILTCEDFILMQLSWVFDFNYAPAVRYVAESGNYNRFIRALESPDALRAAEHVLAVAGMKSHE
jgi:hypothetical protein